MGREAESGLMALSVGLDIFGVLPLGAYEPVDVQFAFGLAFSINDEYISHTSTDEPYNDWLDFVLAKKDIPFVISTSYGEAEQIVPEDYARRACASFAYSMFFSSGDGGVGDGNEDPATQQCIMNDGRNIKIHAWLPGFLPIICAHICGGTIFVPEVAVFSGGGFSDYWPRPAYQEKAVSAFLKKPPKDTYKDLLNPKGRAFPDIAAEGRFFRIWLSGIPRSIGGTSASSPAFAGIVALLNDARLKAKRPNYPGD
ncbi:hypothetical protein VNI00_016451 [Paramarasmius palmivorus]|uniref:Peptidase S53 domain-containing protein n=1 Tax=Paramarasmius palmivorus TaxID=297713 RepID=A0AAW0BEE2_9AGAR